MPVTHKNRLVSTVSAVASSGLGAFTVSSASSGYRTFGASDDGKTFDVLITEGTAWEVRTGCAYTHSGTTLARGTLEDSSTGSAVAFTSACIITQSPTADWGQRLERAMQGITPGGRLTLESGVPVSTTDQTAKTTIYYTPFVHDTVPLWDGARWVPTTFAETSLALGTLTSSRPYDVFGYLSSGVLALESLAWTNDTTRATAVTLQDGRYCKSGDKTRLLLGTFYTTSTTATADALANRYLSNAYNLVPRRFYGNSSASHTYTTGSWREWNAGTSATRVRFVVALPGQSLQINFSVNFTRGGAGVCGYTNLGYDATDGSANLVTNQGIGDAISVTTAGVAALQAAPGAHYLAIVQFGVSGTTYVAYDVQGALEC